MQSIIGAKEITPAQYAKAKGCRVQYILKLLSDGKSVKHVMEVKKFSRFYVLVVPSDFSKKYFSKRQKLID